MAPAGLTPTIRQSAELICGPVAGWDIVQFFALNYLAHAFTVKSLPGTTTRVSVHLALCALLLPYSGVMRAYNAIKCAKLGDNELRHAQRVGALCMVKRYSDNVRYHQFRIDSRSHVVQGQISGDLIGKGYVLVLVPWGVLLVPLNISVDLSRQGTGDAGSGPDESRHTPPYEENADDIHIANTNTTLKSIIAIGQLIYASFTLYKTSDGQVERWGYASFGLTVIPYAVMSLLNLLANALSPDFPTLSLIRTEDMNEAEREGIYFTGVVARVADNVDLRDSQWASKQHGHGFRRTFPPLLMAIFALVIPYVIITVLTHSQPRQSSSVERGLIMTWLVGGQAFGACIGVYLDLRESEDYSRISSTILKVLWFYGFMTIAGMVVVGKQLVAYGNCIENP